MDSAQKATLLQFFKAVGQPERLKMLGILANDAYTIPALAKEMGIKETAVAKNIRVLKKAGLVEEQNNTVQLDRAGLEKMQHVIDGGTLVEIPFAVEVLAKYVKDGQLTAVPKEEDEREVILDWLAQKFDLERRYTEEEVTAIVAQYYRYPLILRRELADNKFLMQTGRHYWRPLPKWATSSEQN